MKNILDNENYIFQYQYINDSYIQSLEHAHVELQNHFFDYFSIPQKVKNLLNQPMKPRKI